MRLAICGSVATDHLMTFPGRFSDSLVAERLERVSLSFLVDGLEVRRGGCGANIAYSLALLGVRPRLVAAVGPDFDEGYRAHLEEAGVDCGGVHVSSRAHTARFLCTTDTAQCQIASFYPGAMSEASGLDLAVVAPDADLVLVGPDDPGAMLRHTSSCRDRGVPFACDPSQQLARMDGADIRDLVRGAAFLMLNDYEATVLSEKTGWTAAQVAAQVDVRVTTLGASGARVDARDGSSLLVPAPEAQVVEPTGVGDAFRAGYLAAHAGGRVPRVCAQLGAVVAERALACTGTQEHDLPVDALVARAGQVYGQDAATDLADLLGVGAGA